MLRRSRLPPPVRTAAISLPTVPPLLPPLAPLLPVPLLPLHPLHPPPRRHPPPDWCGSAWRWIHRPRPHPLRYSPAWRVSWPALRPILGAIRMPSRIWGGGSSAWRATCTPPSSASSSCWPSSTGVEDGSCRDIGPAPSGSPSGPATTWALVGNGCARHGSWWGCPSRRRPWVGASSPSHRYGL